MSRQRRRAGGRGRGVRVGGNWDRQEGRESSEAVEADGSGRPEEVSMEEAAAEEVAALSARAGRGGGSGGRQAVKGVSDVSGQKGTRCRGGLAAEACLRVGDEDCKDLKISPFCGIMAIEFCIQIRH